MTVVVTNSVTESLKGKDALAIGTLQSTNVFLGVWEVLLRCWVVCMPRVRCMLRKDLRSP